MKKIISCLLAVLILFSFAACATGAEKEFTSNGMTLTLTDEFRETTYEGYTVCYESKDVAVFVLKESFSLQAGLGDMSIDDYAELVMITHATDISADRIMWKPAHKIGEYELVYEDGTSSTTPIFYGDNIYKFSQTYGAPLISPLFRHEGYTGTYTSRPVCGKDNFGNDYTLLECPVVNPSPEKKISKVVAKHMENTDAKILIFDAKAIH